MITSSVNGDVFRSPFKHIAFAINREGANDSGFAGLVSRRYCPDLGRLGTVELGSIVVFNTASGYSFYALCCHSLEPGGWRDTPAWITRCLDRLLETRVVPDLACVAIGGGPVGIAMGADLPANLTALNAHPTKLTVFSL